MKTKVALGLLCFMLSSLAFGKPTQFLPQGPCSQIIHYSYYSLCYEKEHRQSSWTKHQLTPELIKGQQKRTNDYRHDPLLPGPVKAKDYHGSGYDRGHLVPAADMKLNHQSMSETFYMTNMSPQVAGFNRRIWAGIESHIRSQVSDFGMAHVITAPVLTPDLEVINSGVTVPRWYYKIAYFPEFQFMEAYLIENKNHPGAKIEEFLVTVDEIEALTGFDFYSELPTAIESLLESQISPHSAWR